MAIDSVMAGSDFQPNAFRRNRGRKAQRAWVMVRARWRGLGIRFILAGKGVGRIQALPDLAQILGKPLPVMVPLHGGLGIGDRAAIPQMDPGPTGVPLASHYRNGPFDRGGSVLGTVVRHRGILCIAKAGLDKPTQPTMLSPSNASMQSGSCMHIPSGSFMSIHMPALPQETRRENTQG
jgi:hypothetical protein